MLEFEEKPFEQNVALVTTGDDSLGSVSDEVADQYNMISLGKYAKEAMGIKYTAAR